MFEKFPPPIGAMIEDFFNEPFFGQTDDDLALDPANELELQHPDLSVADCERLAREAVEERSAASRAARRPTSSIPAQAFARLELGLGSSSFIPLAPQAVADAPRAALQPR